MSLTLSYAVTGLKVKDEVNNEGVTLENAVCQTYWKVTGTDADGNTAEWSGATPFTAKTVPAGSFVDFASLQEETVIGWITAIVEADPSYKNHIEEQLQRQIDQEITTEPTLPWAQETDVAEAAAAAENPEA